MIVPCILLAFAIAIAVPLLGVKAAAATLLGLAIIMVGGWWVLRNRIRLWRIRHRGGHLVVAGDETLAPIIVGEGRAGTPAIVLARDAKPAWLRHIHRVGSPHVRHDRLGGLHGCLRKARLALVAGSDEAATIADARAILAERDQLASRAIAMPMVVRIDDFVRHDAVERSLADAVGTGVHLRLVSLPALMGRMLLRANLLDRVERVGSARLLVVIVGFTPVTERYLLDVLVGAHFRDGRDPLIIVLDAAASDGMAAFRRRWPGLDQRRLPLFETANIARTAALSADIRRIIAEHGLPAAIVIDAADETASVAALQVIGATCDEAGGVAPAYAVHAGASAVAATGIDAIAFGGADIAERRELLLYERQESVARAIHDFYLEGRLDEGESLGSKPDLNGWDALPETIRDDYRLLVDCYLLKLSDIGARTVAGRGPLPSFDPEELAELSAAEASRATAARQLAGRDGATADKAGHSLEQIHIVTRLLARAGRRVVRDLPVLVEAGYDGDIALAASTLAAAYPDHVLVFLADIADARASAALAAAQALGHVTAVAVADDATPAELGRHRLLIRDADHIIALPAGEDAATVLGQRAHHRLTAAMPARRDAPHARRQPA